MARKKKEQKEEVVIEDKKKTEVVVEKSKYSFDVWEVVAISLIAIVFGLLLGSFIVYNKYHSDKGKRKDNLDELREVYNSILDDYYKEVDEDALLDGAINGMIQALDDPYALYLNQNEALSFNEQLQGSYNGLGVTIGINTNNQIIIKSIKEDSPADKAGFKVGDIILKMGDKSFDGDNYEEMIYDIRTGGRGEERIFEIRRGDEQLSITVTLDTVELESVLSTIYEVDDKKVGLILIGNFASNTYSQFLENYKKLEEKGIDSLIIDLRYNGGGYLSSAKQIASLFLEKGSVVFKNTDGKNIETIKTDSDKVIDVPVVLIINEYTASSAEVFASCLAENLKVDIVGVKSYGKGTVQKLMPLTSGAYVKYSVTEWLTADGNKIDGIGVSPTKEVLLDTESNFDAQLDAALQIAKSK